MAPQLKLGKSTYVQFADGTPVVACDVDTRAVVAATTAGTVYVVSVQYTSGGHVQECRLLTRTVVAGQPRHVAICPLNQWAIVTSDASVRYDRGVKRVRSLTRYYRWLQLTNAGPHDVPDSDAVLVGPPRWTYVCSDKRPLVAAMDQHNRVVFLSPRRKCLPVRIRAYACVCMQV
jgi:DNA-binding beta-propeller fold protein YncE